MYYICIDPGTGTPSDTAGSAASAASASASSSSSLVHYCRNCGHREPVRQEICVSKLQIKHAAQNYGNIINRYTKLDPTLPRISHVTCPNHLCASNTKEKEKGQGQSQSQSEFQVPREVIYLRYDEENMKYVYLCAVCDALWSTVQSAAPI
jgi:DNA-directed RNA polymerase subunit M/transcription elongation factor TFIIS